MSEVVVNPLITEEQLRDRMESLAKEIAAGVEKEVMVISLLKGSFMFTADLIRALHKAGVRAQMDFMTLSSYGEGTESSGKVIMKSPLTEEITDKDVLVVDDILESGRTLQFAKKELKRLGAKSVKVAVLLEKPGKLAVDMEADFIGFTIPDKFVVGYGLDHANYYRELPYVGVVANAV
ncbi:MAG: hypoxanthine phosphoribosyltransferase [Alphaproteobacteria bacterium]|nr:hypoxanthine phosphoribosyltransferase [Alphaproteobacteria bacterium]